MGDFNIKSIEPRAADLFTQVIQVYLSRSKGKMKDAHVGHLMKLFVHLAGRCSSPIEQAMVALIIGCEDIVPRGHKINVSPQSKIGKYTIDFRIDIGGTTIAIECDGHDYHERTKDQAKKDRTRDRYLLSQGIKTIRFTGSEIWSESLRCFRELRGLLSSEIEACKSSMTANDQKEEAA